MVVLLLIAQEAILAEKGAEKAEAAELGPK